MNNPKRVVIGTRGSNLALIQTAIVEQTLTLLYPEIAFETKIIQTKGDTDHSPIPLDTVGKEVQHHIADNHIEKICWLVFAYVFIDEAEWRSFLFRQLS